MGDLLARFKDHLVTLGISDGSIRNYLSDLNHFQNWLGSSYPKHSFADLNSEHPLAYRTYLIHELEAPVSSVNRRLSSLRQFFTWAVSQNLLPAHPMQGLGNVSIRAGTSEIMPNQPSSVVAPLLSTTSTAPVAAAQPRLPSKFPIKAAAIALLTLVVLILASLNAPNFLSGGVISELLTVFRASPTEISLNPETTSVQEITQNKRLDTLDKSTQDLSFEQQRLEQDQQSLQEFAVGTQGEVENFDSTTENSLQNTSFELNPSGAPLKWQYFNFSSPANTAVTQDGAHTGANVLKFSLDGIKYGGLTQSQSKTRSDSPSALSVWVRGTGLSYNGLIKLGFKDDTGKYAAFQDFYLGGSFGWQRLTVSANGQGLYPAIEFRGYSTGSAYLDDWQLTGGRNQVKYAENKNSGQGSVETSGKAEIFPVLGGSGSLGTSLSRFGALYLSGATIDSSGNVSISGTTISKDIKPLADKAYDLGSSSYYYRTVYAQSIIADGTTIGGDQTILGNLTVAGTSTLIGNVSAGSNLTVAGTTTLTGLLTSNGGITTNNANINAGTGAISGGSIAGATLTTTGNTSVGGDLSVSGATTLNGLVNLGASSSNDIAVNGRFTTSLIPKLTANVDLGSTTLRWNNLWVQTINATGTNTSGQASFTYDPLDTTITQSSVLINPTSAGPNEALLGLAIGGSERARLDTEGDLVLGFAGGTLTPNSNPLTIYNHSTTQVATIDISGNAYFAGNTGIGDSIPSVRLALGGTGSANGIVLGDDAIDSVNLYRSAANTLKTDDDLVIGSTGNGKITVGVVDPYLITNNGTFQGALEFRTTATAGADDFIFEPLGVEKLRLSEAGNLSISGTGTFSTATGAISLNGPTSLTGTNTLTVGTGATTLGGTLAVTGGGTFSSTLGVNGLLTASGGLTVTGATNINTSGANASNIGTGTNTGTITIGNASGGDLVLSDAQWSVSGAGAAVFSSLSTGTGSITGGAGTFTSISNSGFYTQSGTSANTFTGATTFSAAGTALSVTNNASIGGTLLATGVATFGSSGSFASTLTASNGLTLTTGALNLTSTSGSLSLTAGGANASLDLKADDTLRSFTLSNTGADTVAAGTPDFKLIVKGGTTQTGNLVELQNAAGTVLAKFAANGDLTLGSTGNGKITVGVVDPYLITNTGTFQSFLEFRNTATAGADDFVFTLGGAERARLTETGNLTILGTLTAQSTSTSTFAGSIDMQNNVILNIGNSGTDFVATTGALNLAGVLSANGGITLGTSQTFSATSGTLSATGLSASTISTTSANLTLSTVTAGTLVLTSAGALNLTAGSASTFTLANVANSLNFDANTLSIDSLNNRVGIGNSAPGTTLDVTGTGSFSSTLTASSGFTLTAGALNLTSTSGTISATGLGASTIGTTSANLTLSTTTSGILALTSAGALNLSAGAASNFTLANVVNALNFDADTLSIDALNNRVGIGTSAPGQKLELYNGNELYNRASLNFTPESTPAAPTVAIGSATGLTGTFNYQVTFVTASGETEGGIVSANVTVANQKIDLSAIPTGTVGVVTARKIYRSTAGPITPRKLVTTISDNTTTTYTDNIADASLGIQVPAYNTTASIQATGTQNLVMVHPAGKSLAIVDSSTNLLGKLSVNVIDPYLIVNSGEAQSYLEFRNTATSGADDFVFTLGGVEKARLAEGGNLTVVGQVTAQGTGTNTFSGTVDMQNNLLLNIGNAGTDFTTGGGLNLATDLSIGTNPAASGPIRIPNNVAISARNAANTGDVPLIFSNTSDNVTIRNSSDLVVSSGRITVGNEILVGTTPATTGVIRIPTGLKISSRNAANTADLGLLYGSTVDSARIDVPLTVTGNYIEVGGQGIAGSGVFRMPNATNIVARNFANTGDVNVIGVNTSDNVLIRQGTGQTVVGDGFLSVGATPALTGTVRLPNAVLIAGRNAANTADYALIGIRSTNNIAVGNQAGSDLTVYSDGGAISVGATPSLTGAIRLPNATSIKWRNAANTADVSGISINGGNSVTYDGIAGGAHQFLLAGTGQAEIGTGYLSVGTTTATTGVLRLPNNTGINFRNSANTADIQALAISSADNLQITSSSTLNISTVSGLATWTLQNVANAMNFDVDTFSIDALNNRVGIGNAAPGTTLDVTGTGRFSTTLTASSGFTLSAGALNLTSTSGAISATGLGSSTIGTTSSNLTLTTTTSGTLALTSAGALNLSAGAASTFTLANVANAFNFDADTLSIDALNNRVGIGTSGPAEKLEIENGNVLLDHSNLKLTPELSPGAPTVAINAVAGNLNGAYTYKITFVTASGETQGGTTSASVAPVNQQVNLTAIPTGTAGFVTARKIYRTAAAGVDGTQKLVTTIADNTTTTYTDNLADASLGATVSKTNSTANIQVTNIENLYLVAGTGKAVVVGDGTGKITAGTFDPVYKIDGVNYSTYAPSMLGVKEEITGDVSLTYDGANNNYSHTLNLANASQGSDIWVFSRVSDPDVNMTTVLVSATTSARVWYLKDAANRSITFFSDRATSVSYRLTAPRFDHLKWNTLSEDQTTNGLTPPPAETPVGGEAGSLSVNSYFGAFSENFNTVGTVTAGDLLSVDPTSSEGKLTRSNGAYDSKVTGVATSDGPIATVTSAGRVQVRVSVENGNIAPGDHLTSSATKPGFAMKATQAGRAIGVALQPLTGSDGTILVSVTPSWFDPTAPIYNPNGTVAPTSSNASATYDTLTATTANITNLNIGGVAIVTDESGNLKVNGNVIITGKGTFAEVRVNGLLTIIGAISAPNGLAVNLGLSKSFEIKSATGDTVAQISDEGVLITKSAEVNELKVSTVSAQPTTGTTLFRAGGTSMLIETTKITQASKIVVTFKGDYAPATRYWTSDEVSGSSFTLHLDQAPTSDVSFNWWIIN